MTTARYATICNGHLNAVIINGRQTIVKRITEIRATRPGNFEGLANGEHFHIEGGRAAGGTSRDWFVSWAGAWDGYIKATSLVNAIKLIEGA